VAKNGSWSSLVHSSWPIVGQTEGSPNMRQGLAPEPPKTVTTSHLPPLEWVGGRAVGLLMQLHQR
jgi:hypothetical protein